MVISIADGSLARGCFDSFHTLALRCREREPSTPSAWGRKQTPASWPSARRLDQAPTRPSFKDTDFFPLNSSHLADVVRVCLTIFHDN